ncbi:HD domain-containing protein [Spirosoma taeanense]|uniref:HD domain-containing protein n=1 Tax=Spirosoma taeanense TaxID=2735870 RepID=A0A6M5YAC2_9BACT|nr:HD domain-containing protein [Spirosoma taeanense]QJW90171.1 HD domain-containing protein [Spirosoma taeanense]
MESQAAETYILQLLQTDLSPTLYYHGLHHTLDVYERALHLARAEGIDRPEQLTLLRTAACFHDAGFLVTYQQHEDAGCRMVRELLPGYQYSTDQIDSICGMIMATQLPQAPHTPLEQILCDADLDYLGRDDFEPIAYSLFRELQARNMVTDEQEWNHIQVNFLESHQYWTATAAAWRQTGKQKRLDALRALIAQ